MEGAESAESEDMVGADMVGADMVGADMVGVSGMDKMRNIHIDYSKT